MRIALFSDTYVPEINGVASSTYILKNELEKNGHDVFVVTTFAGEGRIRWEDNNTVLRLAGMELKFLYGYVMTSPIHFHALDDIKELNLDIIHAQTEFGIGIFARICAKQLRIPLVSTYHTTYEDYTHYVNFINSKHIDELAKKAVAKISKLYGDSSMRVIAPSAKTKDMLLGYGIKREIDVIPTGLQLDTFHPSLEDTDRSIAIRQEYGFTSQDHVVIYVGRIAEEKSLDIVVRGFAKAIHEDVNVKLLIVGDGPQANDIRKLVQDEQCEESIILCGPKKREEVPDYYRACDAFISASLSETQGMTFIEALAAGLPLYARRDEVLENLIIDGKTGSYFVDEDDLASQLKSFALLSHEEIKKYKNDCVDIVSPYSSNVFYEKVIEVYEKAIDAYSHQFHIDDVKVKDSTVVLQLSSDAKETKKIEVSIDDYYEYGLRKDGILVQNEIENLQDRQKIAIAYQSCIKKISYKDRTRQEIIDYLEKNEEFDDFTIQAVIEKLEEKGYLNDDAYADEAISSMQHSLQGPRKMVQKLKNHGITEALLNQKESDLYANEEEHARKYAMKLLVHMQNESVRKARMTIQTKLVAQGYSQEIAIKVASELDYEFLRETEIDSLHKCIEKAKRKYEKKYEGRELRDRIFRYCALQGYNSEDISIVLDEME